MLKLSLTIIGLFFAAAAISQSLPSTPCRGLACPNENARRLDDAFSAEITTDAQRAEMGRIIARHSSGSDVNWPAAADEYFSWRNGKFNKYDSTQVEAEKNQGRLKQPGQLSSFARNNTHDYMVSCIGRLAQKNFDQTQYLVSDLSKSIFGECLSLATKGNGEALLHIVETGGSAYYIDLTYQLITELQRPTITLRK